MYLPYTGLGETSAFSRLLKCLFILCKSSGGGGRADALFDLVDSGWIEALKSLVSGAGCNFL